MGQPSGLLGFEREAFNGVGGAVAGKGLEHFHRHRHAQPQVYAEVNRRHAAVGQLADEHGRIGHLIAVQNRGSAQHRVRKQGRCWRRRVHQ